MAGVDLVETANKVIFYSCNFNVSLENVHCHEIESPLAHCSSQLPCDFMTQQIAKLQHEVLCISPAWCSATTLKDLEKSSEAPMMFCVQPKTLLKDVQPIDIAFTRSRKLPTYSEHFVFASF